MLILINSLYQAVHRKNPNLLQVSARPWLHELGIQRLKDVPDKVLDDIVAQGIDAIYLLGVWEIGQYGYNFDKTDPALIQRYLKVLPDLNIEQDVTSTVFDVVRYSINEKEIGVEADLIQFRERLHQRGMMLWLDYVSNHAAVDSDLVASNPEYFVQSKTIDPAQQYTNGIYYAKDKYGNLWPEEVQLNHWHPEVLQSRIDDLMLVAKFADGTRADMAMLLINDEFEEIWGAIVKPQGFKRPADEFWTVAIREVKKVYPNFKLQAEVYWGRNDFLISMGFDYAYDKDKMLYDNLRDKNITSLKKYIRDRNEKLAVGSHFIENHDEKRAAEIFGSNKMANAAGLISYTLPGMRFHFQGQWLGRKNQLDANLRRSYDMEHDMDQNTINFYNILLPLLDDEIWHTGQYVFREVTGTSDCDKLMAWTWELEGEMALIIVNYTPNKASGKVKLSVNQNEIHFEEKLFGESYTVSKDELERNGFFTIVEPWEGHIYYFNK
ncbi:Alpha_amylase catalytic region [Hexamita inflata]|uniref:Alpha amylase catalytic region n=1 Tax=Hexamita inflata TaxID=28002 RepID=A0AA86U0V0_9EUKA|nr:Alpha amylase catalytic region [Hexamita inflata]CAI9968341.1 Alpha amylase catalytic region [Hexamita inflata]